MSTGFTWGPLTVGHGTAYRVDTFTGWDGPPLQRIDAGDRPNMHGGFDAPGWSSPRTVTVQGSIINRDARDQLYSELVGSIAPGLDDLVGTTAERTLTASARLSGFDVASTRQQWAGGGFAWTIQFRCPDARRYGEERVASTPLPVVQGGLSFPLFAPPARVLSFGLASTTGRVTLTNEGSADTWPMVRVWGPLPSGFDVLETTTGRIVRYLGPVSAGQFVDLDFRTGSVLLDGVADRRGLLAVAQWWAVPRRGFRQVLFVNLAVGAQPDALLQATYRPAHW